MFPGLGGLNPKKMQAMMKQLGMSQEEIDASRVVIEKPDDSKLIIENPSVTKMNIQGKEMFQISGDVREEAGEKFSEEDVKTVMEKSGSDEARARSALEDSNGDLAEAILGLSS
ncbi:MAG: nascent polypeptide-associated complex protein [Nanoarchaeota archaeon]|nr:nascent polypeptide-associated complex protein [Nanoarchaeota archaeon]MBU1501614.1 nascent polypeptide-associated complex protein [Nanoarchaeota archaeon]MBU2459182.1 nascent polypeptide-associated complex protein [Nanoarchaeota archaeon]